MSLVEDISAELMRHYCFLRARSQGLNSISISKEKWGKFFDKAAEMCIRLSLDPREYLEVEFQHHKPYPHINVLGSDKAEGRFFAHREELAANVATRVNIQTSAVDQMINKGISPKEILTDPRQEWDALFVYIVANQYELDDIAKSVLDSAANMYLRSCYYDQLYGEAITDELKARAREIKYGE